MLDRITSLKSSPDILVVDDNSSDNTVSFVKSFASPGEKVRLISNPAKEHGLAFCYKAGFDYAIRAGYKSIITMDADFSHDPGDIPRMLNEKNGADWIIGSRCVKGGSSCGLGLVRFIISRAGNFLIRKNLNFKILDVTSGFNCIDCRLLQKIDFASIPSKGFIFQVELKYLGAAAGADFKEIPIKFHRRRAGSSKFSLAIISEALRRIKELKHR